MKRKWTKLFGIIFLLYFSLLVRVVWSNEKKENEFKFNSEEQELFLAKAELAFSDGDEKEGMRLLNSSINDGGFHLETYQFIIDVFFEKGKYFKGARVYRRLIENFHTDELIKVKNVTMMKELLDVVETPSKNALILYFSLAELYYNLTGLEGLKEKQLTSLYARARKYFIVCSYYNFNLSGTRFYLGDLYNKLEQNKLAVDNLLIAKELYLEEGIEKESDDIKNIDFLLADSLLKSGHSDAATIYLKHIYRSPGKRDPKDKKLKESPLKAYAKSYLDSFFMESLSLTPSYSMDTDNNVSETTTSSEITSSKISTKSFNLFVSTKKFLKIPYEISLDFSEILYANSTVSDYDSRSLSTNLSLHFENWFDNILKVDYNFSRSYTKNSETSSFEGSSNSHIFTPQYAFNLMRGTFALSFPMTLNDNLNSEGTTDFGSSVTFTPFWHHDYLMPNFSLEYTYYGAISGEVPTGQIYLSVTNSSNFSDYIGLFLALSYTHYMGETETDGYGQIDFNPSLSLMNKWLPNLSLSFSMTNTLKKIGGGGGTMKKNSTSMGLSYSF